MTKYVIKNIRKARYFHTVKIDLTVWYEEGKFYYALSKEGNYKEIVDFLMEELKDILPEEYQRKNLKRYEIADIKQIIQVFMIKDLGITRVNTGKAFGNNHSSTIYFTNYRHFFLENVYKKLKEKIKSKYTYRLVI